jgi:hypothetical protein
MEAVLVHAVPYRVYEWSWTYHIRMVARCNGTCP